MEIYLTYKEIIIRRELKKDIQRYILGFTYILISQHGALYKLFEVPECPLGSISVKATI